MALTVGLKAATFAQDAIEAGWTAHTFTNEDGYDIVQAHYGSGETRRALVLFWLNDRYVYESSFQGTGPASSMKMTTIRNASEARRILAEATGVRIETKKVPKQRQAEVEPQRDFDAEDRPRRPEKKRLPFKVSSPDADILKAVVGKTIVWWNERARRTEQATVLAAPNQRQLRIERTMAQKRVLTFAALGEGFRSVYVEAILEIYSE